MLGCRGSLELRDLAPLAPALGMASLAPPVRPHQARPNYKLPALDASNYSKEIKVNDLVSSWLFHSLFPYPLLSRRQGVTTMDKKRDCQQWPCGLSFEWQTRVFGFCCSVPMARCLARAPRANHLLSRLCETDA